jgi:TonB family protein
MRSLTLVLALSVSMLAAQAPRITPPRITYKVQPEYSEEGRQAHVEGTIILRIVVGADGKPRDFLVQRGLGLGLDEKAIAAVSAWKFSPGLKDGQPVNVYAQIEVNFRLLDKDSKARWHLHRVEFHLADGSLRPMIEKGVSPRTTDDANAATATVTFDIDASGAPVNVHIEKSSDDNWARRVTEAIVKWSFTPGSQNGVPVPVSCSMDFVQGEFVP